ncbi:MAG: MATE family efflux transporter [Propylenella sp.]
MIEGSADAPTRAFAGESIRPFEVTHAAVFRLAVPMTLAYLSVPLIGVIDTVVIGQLGVAALIGGIAVGAIILDILFTTCNFLRSGTTGLTAQAVGAADRSEIVAVLLRALIVAGVISVVVLVLQVPFIEVAVWFMDPGPAVVAPIYDYLYIRIWETPLTLANYALLGWLVGLGRSMIVLGVQTLLAGLNVLFSVWFVLWLDLGVPGVAWASVLAEALIVLAQIPIVLKLAPLSVMPSWVRIFERRGFSRLIGVNRDIMIRSFVLLFAFAFFTRQGAQYGAVVLAANAILMHFFVVGGYFLDGFATAAEQLAGRAVGARFRPAFERTVRLTMLWGFSTGVVLSLVYLAFGPLIIDLMTTAGDVRAVAREFLPWAVLTPIAGVIAFQMDGIFIGATWSRDMRNMMLLSAAIYLAAWAALTPLFGNHGLWMALLIFLSARSFTFHWRMRRLLPRTFPAKP